MKDANGEDGAWDRISRTEKDFRVAVLGQGAIKPFRFGVEHGQLLELIICFEDQRLNAEELAHCVDCYCGCCTEHHEANTLKRLRARLEADLRNGMPWKQLTLNPNSPHAPKCSREHPLTESPDSTAETRTTAHGIAPNHKAN